MASSAGATSAADAPEPAGTGRGRPMIRRYTLAEMGAIWSEAARFEAMLEVEIAVARVQAARGLIPADALAAIEDARPGRRRPDRRDRADDRPRRHRLRQPGRRAGRARGSLPAPRPDEQRRRRHRARAPAPRRRPAPARRLRPPARRDHRPGPDRGGHADDGPDPFGPCRAHDARGQARELGVRARPGASPAGRGGRRDRHRQDLGPGRDLQPSRPRARGRGPRRSRAAGRPRQQPDRPARPPRRPAHRDRDRRRLARAVRDRGPQSPAHRDRRAPGAVPGRPEGFERDAPQAQPDRVRADRRASPGSCAATPGRRSRTSRSGTSGTSATARPSGSSCPTPRSCSTTCSSG